jgi:Fe2+ or Zn2+ uptake regulation protein
MAVLSTERPVTAYEILDLLRPKDPSATPAGIYRSLDFLTELGSSYRVCQELHRLCDAGSRASQPNARLPALRHGGRN